MKLTNRLIDDETDSNEQEIIKFGVEQLTTLVVGAFVTLIIGVLLNEPIRTAMLLLCLLPLRQNAGGFHLSKKWSCTVVSVLLLITMILIIKYLSIPRNMSIVLLALGSIPIVFLSPVGNANRRLDQAEIRVFGNRAKMIWLAQTIVFFILWILDLSQWYIIILLSITVSSLLVLLGFVQEHCKGDGLEHV